MSLLKLIKAQLGLSATPANNFTFDASADNGTMKLARGNAGATTQDLVTVSAANVITGASGAVLVGNGPAFFAYGTTPNQSVTPGIITKVTLQQEQFDTANAFDTTTNYRFQPTVAGYYQFNGVLRTSANTGVSSVEFVALYGTNANLAVVAGELLRGNEVAYSNRQSASAQSVVSGILYMNGTTDYVELWGYINATNTSFANATTVARCSLSGSLVRAA